MIWILSNMIFFFKDISPFMSLNLVGYLSSFRYNLSLSQAYQVEYKESFIQPSIFELSFLAFFFKMNILVEFSEYLYWSLELWGLSIGITDRAPRSLYQQVFCPIAQDFSIMIENIKWNYPLTWRLVLGQYIESESPSVIWILRQHDLNSVLRYSFFSIFLSDKIFFYSYFSKLLHFYYSFFLLNWSPFSHII